MDSSVVPTNPKEHRPCTAFYTRKACGDVKKERKEHVSPWRHHTQDVGLDVSSGIRFPAMAGRPFLAGKRIPHGELVVSGRKMKSFGWIGSAYGINDTVRGRRTTWT